MAVLRRDFSAAPRWGLKDPRLCRLLPWWETLWPEMGSRPLFLLVRRAPAEVAASLARREGMSPAKAYLLWLRHTLEAEQATRNHDRLFLDFADFRRDEHAALQPVRQRLGLTAQLPTGGTPLVDPGLGRRGAPAQAGGVPSLVQEVDAALCQGVTGDEITIHATLDRLAVQAAANLAFPQTEHEISADLHRQLAATRKLARWYEAEWRKAQARADKLNARLESRLPSR